MLFRGVVLLSATLLWAGAAQAVLLTGGIPSGMTSAQQPALTWYQEGLAALSNNDLEGAQRAFEQSAKLGTELPFAWIGLAEVAIRKQDNPGAKNYLDNALRVAPESPQVHHALGRYFYAVRDYAAAENAFKEVLAWQPRNLLAQIDIADLYVNALHRPTLAVAAYRSALAINPNHAGANHGLGMTLMMLNRPEEAETALRRAAELAPENPLPRQALGKLYLSENNAMAAIQAFDAALTAQPNFVPALLSKGDIFLGRGDFERAAAEYRKATEIAPKHQGAQLKLGMAYQALDQPEQAETAYLAALESNPQLALAYNNLAWMAVERRTDLAKARAWAETAVALAPAVPAFQDTLGWVYFVSGDMDGAERILTQAKQLSPPLAGVHYHLGRIYEQQGETEKAVQAFRNALAINAEYAPARQALQRIQSR